jgi:Tfp pilus assembly protein PilF
MKRSRRCARFWAEEGLAPGTAGNARVALARMLLADGDVAGARALVEEVRGTDPGQVDALKMLAAWLIEEDRRRCCDRAAAHGSRSCDPRMPRR